MMKSFDLASKAPLHSRAALLAALLAVPCLAAAAPMIKYTDLAFAPNGAFVTVFGAGLNEGAVAGAEVVSRSDSQVVLRWQGTAASIGGVNVPVVTRAGRVLEATTSTLSSVCSSATSGDVIYLRAGTYTARCGSTTWGAQQFNLGSKFSNVSFVGYPGEVASLNEVRMGDGAGMANGVTLANLKLKGMYCVYGESWWEEDESGAKDGRVVNVDCAGNYGSSNTMTGLVGFGADGWKVLGSRFTNNAPAPINNNHAVYITVGSDNIEVAWNRFSNMKMGHVIQVHTDGPSRVYQNISIHDNEMFGTSPNDIRGINISACTSDSNIDIYNNVLINLGQDFSGINTYCGTVKIRQNTLGGIAAPPILVQGGSVTAQNNILLGRASSGSFTSSNNVTSGTLDSAYRLATPVMAPNVGITMDHAGVARGGSTAVGAYENGPGAVRPNPPTGVAAL